MAALYAASNQSAEAKREFAKAIEEAPKDDSIRCDAAYFALQTGELDTAEKHLQFVLDSEPDHQKALMHLAMLRAKQDRWPESFDMFSRAVGPAAAHSNVGVLLAAQHRQAEATAHFEEARKLDPSLPLPKPF